MVSMQRRKSICVYTYFIIIIAYRCGESDSTYLPTNPCLKNAKDDTAEGYSVVAAVFGRGSKIPGVTQLSKILSSSSQITSMDDSDRQCFQYRFNKVEDVLAQMKRQISSFESNSKLERIQQETREILRNIGSVYKHVKRLTLFKSLPIAKRRAKSACKSKSPLDILNNIRYQTVNSAQMFDAIAEGTQYSLPFFNNITSLIMSEVGLCALLAIECNRIELIGNESSQAYIDHDLADINATLNAIETALDNSRSNLIQNFGSSVPDAIKTALKESNNMALIGQEKVDYIYNYLTKAYPYRSWAVILYNKIRWSAKATHAQVGFASSNWFTASDSDYTIVVHAADKSNEGCSKFADYMHAKRLQDLFDNNYRFEEFATLDGNLENSIFLLKEALTKHEKAPNDLFFAFVLYRNHLMIARDYGDKFNFFENVRIFDSFTKSVFIGWC